jgi:PAS domain S-box-containing protein
VSHPSRIVVSHPQPESSGRPSADSAADRLFALSLDLLSVIGADGYLQRANPAFERMLGWTCDELLARPLIEFVHPDDRAITVEALQQLAAQPRFGAVEVRIECRDGSYRWISWQTSSADEQGMLYAVGRDVTEQRNTAAALLASEGRHRSLFEQSPMATVVFDVAGRPVSCNPAFERMWGVTLDAIPEDFSLFADPQLVGAEILPLVHRAFAGETVQLPPILFDMGQVAGAAGRARWIVCTVYPVRDETGAVVQVVIMEEDVTPRVEAEAERRAAEERFRIVQDASLDSFAIWDAVRGTDGRIEDFMLGYANQTYQRAFQASMEDIRGRGMLECFPTATSSGRFTRYVQVVETGVTDDTIAEYEVDGRWYRMTIAKVRDSIAMNISDITGRIQAEQMLRRSQEELEQRVADRTRALEESRSQFRIAFEQSVVGMSLSLTDGRFVMVNPALSAILGYSEDELLTHTFHDVTYPEDRALTSSAVRGALSDSDAVRHEKRYLTKSGELIWVEVTARLFHAEDGGKRYFIAQIQNITERKRTEAALNTARLAAEEALAAAEAASRAKSEFLAVMSHELRTPLNAIIGFSNVLGKDKRGVLNPLETRYVSRIGANATHLLSLINQVLDLAKIEAQHLEVTEGPLDVGALAASVAQQLEGQLDGRPVTLQTEIPEAVAIISTDAEKLRQVLINLVGNALKFTRKGSVTVRVVTDAKTHVPTRVEVSDTGIGIPSDHLETIFGAFEQGGTGVAREFGGTGLGLAISRALCHALGFDLVVRSTIGVGSTFRVELQRATVTSGA